MSVIKYRVELHIEVDTDEYRIPADGKLGQSLQEDVIDAIERSICVSIESSKITKVNQKYDEVRY